MDNLSFTAQPTKRPFGPNREFYSEVSKRERLRGLGSRPHSSSRHLRLQRDGHVERDASVQDGHRAGAELQHERSLDDGGHLSVF